jgi:SAM-dependent methyltransferase
MNSCRGYFTDNLLEGSARSAAETVPLVLELIQPASAVDVGCGTGSWLSALQQAGTRDVLGVDGPWADTTMLTIPPEQFMAFDLNKPLRLPRRFDLVLSLEVAQHLPAARAGAFVGSLTGLGPLVLFSSAIPYQGGIGHVNEQWPDYWARLFERRGYVTIDPFRRRLWDNENVEWWFAQNLLLFASRPCVEANAALKRARDNTHPAQLALVHPRKYLGMAASADRLSQAAAEVAALVRPEETFILVDQGELSNMIAAGRRALPFLEREGEYWGSPEDDATAIRELERLRAAGASHLVFAWPAFWWLDYYEGLHRHLVSEFRCALRNERLIAFALRDRPKAVPGAGGRPRRRPARAGGEKKGPARLSGEEKRRSHG